MESVFVVYKITHRGTENGKKIVTRTVEAVAPTKELAWQMAAFFNKKFGTKRTYIIAEVEYYNSFGEFKYFNADEEDF